MPNILFIVNNKARFGQTDLHEGTAMWREMGWGVREFHPSHADQIPGLIRRYGNQVDSIVIGGGDGTLNRAAEALIEVDRPVGVIPLGTANDFARTLSIPTDPREACRVICDWHFHEIDLGLVNEKYFFNVANIGLGEKVTRKLSGEAKQRWGILAYLRSFLDAFDPNSHFRVHLTCDGRTETFSSIHVAIGNGRHYGGGMTIAEDATIDDHRLTLLSIAPQSLLELASLALALRRGRVAAKDRVMYRTGREIKIKTDRLMHIETDGELPARSRTPGSFKIVKGALSVHVSTDYFLREKSMFRSEEVVAVDEVTEACQLAVDHFEKFAESAGDENLSHLFRDLAEGHREYIPQLDAEVNRMGELPKRPDTDWETFEQLATKLRSVFFASERDALLDKALEIEKRLKENISRAMTQKLPESVDRLLLNLKTRVEASLERITSMRKG